MTRKQKGRTIFTGLAKRAQDATKRAADNMRRGLGIPALDEETLREIRKHEKRRYLHAGKRLINNIGKAGRLRA